MADEERDGHEGEDVHIFQGASGAFPTGADMVGPGTVRQGSGYSGSTSSDVEPGTGHDPSPYDSPSAGYMGDTTSSDEPAEQVIRIEGDTGP